MKCPQYDIAMVRKNMDKGSPEKSLDLHVKESPSKEPRALKPQCPPGDKLSIVHDDTVGVVYGKENQTLREHARTLEDSGYLSLHTSQIEEEHDHGHARLPKTPLQPPLLPSPKKSPIGTNSNCRLTVVTASTPVERSGRKALTRSLWSTPSEHHGSPNLPIVKFQQAVCEELAKSYNKTKRYDWSVISKVAEDHFLHQVIGRQMGLEYVDVFSSLLSKNMKSILANILALLGDLDLISCRKVSRTWRKIICEDSAALRRLAQAEQTLQESISSSKLKNCGLTRDLSMSRVVMSCMQKVASPHSSSSLSTSCGVNRRTTPEQKGSKSTSQCSRFDEFMKAGSSLKQCQSLRRCNKCGSPAMHSAEVQRATCMRSSCQFDFCTNCQGAFHGSTPCRAAFPRSRFDTSKSTPVLPGSAQSKRNVRRL
ncbi:F-box only protein 5 [Nerophis ophidion]|uniref:F-box only protein 5 n=1 Tax=Nerophis ophidion TaxID=159077 RepID=UPI002ADF8BF2|nr:F-box only protein 5 [Nerophis ophidion]